MHAALVEDLGAMSAERLTSAPFGRFERIGASLPMSVIWSHGHMILQCGKINIKNKLRSLHEAKGLTVRCKISLKRTEETAAMVSGELSAYPVPHTPITNHTS